MSVVLEAQRTAKEIRMRLRNPPNAVQDTGINLRRYRENPPPPLPPVEAKVAVYEIYLPLPKPVEVPKPFVRHYSMKSIFRYSSKEFGVPVEQVYGQSRKKRYATARHVAVYLCSTLLKKSLSEIGRFLHRDHTTCLNSCRVVAARLEKDLEFSEKVELIRNKINELNDRLALSAKLEPYLAVRLEVKESLSQSAIHQVDAGRGDHLAGPEAETVPAHQNQVLGQPHRSPA